MIELKLQKPYIDVNGIRRQNLERHYAEDENGIRYKIKQIETDKIYVEAIDLSPCKYTYEITKDIVVDDELLFSKVEQIE